MPWMPWGVGLGGGLGHKKAQDAFGALGSLRYGMVLLYYARAIILRYAVATESIARSQKKTASSIPDAKT
jgi:hypothetical protein